MPSEDDVAADWAWADRFLPHQAEIAREALRVDVAPLEEDMRHNTDLILRSAVPMRMGRELRISARVRRHEYLNRMGHLPGLAYRNQITIRDRRPSGVVTEMDKVRLGEGDIFVYGFESEPGSRQLYPWAVVNLDMIRDYDMQGGYSTVKRNKGERGSWLRAFHLDDLPLGAVLKSDGISYEDHALPWQRCRNPNWDDQSRPVRSGWCARDYVIGAGRMRKCLFCGFKWRAGWEMPSAAMTEEELISTSRDITPEMAEAMRQHFTFVTRGPCTRCGTECVRYGDLGGPLCESCHALSAYSGRD